MKSVPLTVYPRTSLQRNQVKKLRRTERIPAVIYGRHSKSQPLEITQLDFDRLVHHSATENILVDMDLQGDERPKRLALMQDVQHHALTGKVLHIDFHEVAENEKVVVTVPVEPSGEALGVKNGGILERVLFKVKVRALPKDLPEQLVVDVTALDIGKSIHIGEIPAPAGTEILGDKHIPVISVAAPVTEAEEAAEAAEAAEPGSMEPEMIKEKKEEGAEGAEKAGEKGKPAEKAEKAEKPEKAEKKK